MHSARNFFSIVAAIKYVRRMLRTDKEFDVNRMLEHAFIAFGLPYHEDILLAVSDDAIDSKDLSLITFLNAKAWARYYELTSGKPTDISTEEVFAKLRKLAGE